MRVRCRLLIGQVLDDRGTLGENAAIVETQRRDIALRIDRHVILAAFRFMFGEIDLFQIDREAGFGGDDVRVKANTRRVNNIVSWNPPSRSGRRLRPFCF